MKEATAKQPQPDPNSPAHRLPSTAGDHLGRILFLVAGGLLLAAMVSCSCNPAR